MPKFLCCLLLWIGVTGRAQLTNEGVSARALAIANATSTSTDVWAIHNNVAGLAEFSGTQVGMTAQNQFGMNGFNRIALAGAFDTRMATAGISIKRFGDQLYNETVFGIGAAHNIDFVSLGLKANLLQLSISELGTKQAVALEFGGLIHLNDELTIGANIYNLNQAKLASYNDERFSTVLKAGISYQPSASLQFTAEMEKDVEYKHNVKLGLEYFVIPKLALRTGVSTLTESATFGAGLQLAKLQIDYGVAIHTRLGLTNAVTLCYRIKDAAEKQVP